MRKTPLKNVVLLTLSIAFALVLCEMIVRVSLRNITTTADNRSYFALKWKQSAVRRNSLGFREREFNPDKSADTYRIVFIGDSFTFGQGIAESDRMSNILESQLRDRAGVIEVLNFGNAGNNTSDESRLLQRVLKDFHPDFVLLQWYVNDVENNRQTPGLARDVVEAPQRVEHLKMWLRNHSALYFLAAEAWHQVLTGVGLGYVKEVSKRVGKADSPEWQSARVSLIEFIHVCREQNVPMGIVLVPYLARISENGYAFEYLHERVLAICSREKVKCVDLLHTFDDALMDNRAYQTLWVNRYDSHMSAAANRLAAERLLAEFGSTWQKDANNGLHNEPSRLRPGAWDAP